MSRTVFNCAPFFVSRHLWSYPHLQGVTGRVIEVGLVRIYLMELTGAGSDIHSTGRVAVFSNSIIFQPSALIKQAPGADYIWHQASLLLTEQNDLEEARQRLFGAVQSVYETYKAAIQRQHKMFERTANIETAAPAPTARVLFIEGGYQIVIRFPVKLAAIPETDEAIIHALMKEINRDPKLKLANGGRPKVAPIVP